MSQHEKIEIIKAGISNRPEHYEEVKKVMNLPIRQIEAETGYSNHFIRTVRKIAGWEKRKK